MGDNNDLDQMFDMLYDFQQRRDEMHSKLDDNSKKIQELDYYIKSLSESEEQDPDYSVFSPRKPDQKNKFEIEKSILERKQLDTQNYDLSCEIGKMSHYIEVLENGIRMSHVKKDSNISVLDIQEKERQRIARDLHDTALQNLTYILHKLELTEMFISQDPIRAKLELNVIRKNIKSVIDQVRDSIYDLRPMSFNDLGLKAVFERMLDSLNAEQNYIIESNIEEVSCETSIVMITLYRVVQECISNIMKHSKCQKITFDCHREDDFIIVDISDNGIGFNISKEDSESEKHFGIPVMIERIALLNGEMTIDSQENEGCKIHIKVPVKIEQ